MIDLFQTHGAFSWSELRTDDVEKAKAFYTGVIGWTAEEMSMADGGTYTVLKVGDTAVGGLMAMPEEAKGAPAHWAVYVTVDDVDKRLEMTTAAGGSVLMPAMDIPEVGRIAAVADPTGAAICLITYSAKECD